MRHQSVKAAVAVALVFAGLVVSLVVAGCSHPAPPVPAAEKSHLRVLANSYSLFLVQLKGKEPTEAEFKAYLAKSVPASSLKRNGVNSVDELFVSERDQKPYVVIYGGNSSKKGAAPAIFAYEQEGKDGKRFVAYPGQIEEVDEARFKELLAAAK